MPWDWREEHDGDMLLPLGAVPNVLEGSNGMIGFYVDANSNFILVKKVDGIWIPQSVNSKTISGYGALPDPTLYSDGDYWVGLYNGIYINVGGASWAIYDGSDSVVNVGSTARLWYASTYHPIHDVMYAVTTSGTIWKIFSDGSMVDVGAPSMTYRDIYFNNDDGYMYVAVSGASGNIYRVNEDFTLTSLGLPVANYYGIGKNRSTGMCYVCVKGGFVYTLVGTTLTAITGSARSYRKVKYDYNTESMLVTTDSTMYIIPPGEGLSDPGITPSNAYRDAIYCKSDGFVYLTSATVPNSVYRLNTNTMVATPIVTLNIDILAIEYLPNSGRLHVMRYNGSTWFLKPQYLPAEV